MGPLTFQQMVALIIASNAANAQHRRCRINRVREKFDGQLWLVAFFQ